ncbi:MAG: glycosyltransferase [Anaerolineaceae bacterium]|nr:glycosyltransferase [Anaerolineaceae bacterium]
MIRNNKKIITNTQEILKWLSQDLPNNSHKGNSDLPKISIITPSYNSQDYIEQTIKSVVLQNYQNLEYIIIDGGSTDNTIEIIKKHEERIDYWISEKDSGQSEAINKGIRIATGDWIAWINADDIYCPGALDHVSAIIKDNEEVEWIVGTTKFIDNKFNDLGDFFPQLYTGKKHIQKYKKRGWLDFVCTAWSGIALPQPSSFWKREAVINAGWIDESLHFAMDHEMYGRLARNGLHPTLTQTPITLFRRHDSQKSTKNASEFLQEELIITKRLRTNISTQEKRFLNKYIFWFSIRLKWISLKTMVKKLLNFSQ